MNSFSTYLFKKFIISVLTILAITVLVFLILHLIPGEPVRNMLGETADPEIVEMKREELNLNKPLVVQYFLWMKDVLRGDFGVSLSQATGDIAEAIKVRLPVTLGVGIPAIAVATILGLIIGIVCANTRGSFIDQFLTVLMTIFEGVPVFWVSCIVIWLFGQTLGWLPSYGYVSIFESVPEYITHAILPVSVMSMMPMAEISRQTRTNMLEVINQDYIRTARANGLPKRKVLYRHALKNVLIPIVSLLIIQIRWVVGGALITEQIFSINGMGRLIMIAINNNDYQVIQAATLVLSVIVVGANFLLDLVYGWLDPRIRMSQKRAQ